MSELTVEQRILYGELNDTQARHVANMPYLEEWIIDAMKTYADYRIDLANGIDTSHEQALHKHDVIARLSLKEIEAMVQLLHSADWEYGNSEERCEELKEKTRNKIGYSKSDLAEL